MKNSAEWITQRATDLGFIAVGFVQVEPMDPAPLHEWLQQGCHAGMEYLQRHLPLRADLSTLVPAARTVISVAHPYPDPTDDPLRDALAMYARGHDYHEILQEKLTFLLTAIQQQYPGTEARCFVDSGPLPERELAKRAGIGWVGKHSCMIRPGFGSRFLLGEIITTLPIPSSAPTENRCGSCSQCIHACTTGALVSAGIVDARRCLSYLTIEHKGAIPLGIRPLLGDRLFGCDACQDACPFNERNSSARPPYEDFVQELCRLLYLSDREFNERFNGSPIRRAKRRGLLRNACVLLGNLRAAAAIPALQDALHDREPLVRGHAAWALGQLGAITVLATALASENDAGVIEEINTAVERIQNMAL